MKGVGRGEELREMRHRKGRKLGPDGEAPGNNLNYHTDGLVRLNQKHFLS